MSYFKQFPTINYDFTIKSDPKSIVENITDFCTRVTLRISDVDLDTMCTDYLIRDGETPEKIAYKLYNQPLLHWTILYINGISDIHSEWPLSDIAVRAFAERKYGVSNLYNVHHVEKLPEMLTMDYSFMVEQIQLGNFTQEDILEVTNLELEERTNELKRFIRVIKPEYIATFVTAFEKALTK